MATGLADLQPFNLEQTTEDQHINCIATQIDKNHAVMHDITGCTLSTQS
jgi:hypothetical protein